MHLNFSYYLLCNNPKWADASNKLAASKRKCSIPQGMAYVIWKKVHTHMFHSPSILVLFAFLFLSVPSVLLSSSIRSPPLQVVCTDSKTLKHQILTSNPILLNYSSMPQGMAYVFLKKVQIMFHPPSYLALFAFLFLYVLSFLLSSSIHSLGKRMEGPSQPLVVPLSKKKKKRGPELV